MAENPLLKALPPETDYLSYLTILEYNLTAEQLPTLHDILQDTTLTANIGWDLVHLLLPLLPASQQCLQDVARLGNPREVVLKVTELLEGLAVPDEDDGDVEDENEDQDFEEGGERGSDRLGISTGIKVEEEPQSEDVAGLDIPRDSISSTPSKALRFGVLLEMLSILHPRIKTKYPSRFLSTSLQAALPAYMQVAKSIEATDGVLGFVKELSGTKRPRLPPRKSSTIIPIQAAPVSAPDPEGNEEALGADEAELQSRLLQSFLTYVTEGYVISLASDEDVPGLAWCSRYQEKLQPEKNIPGRTKYSTLFSEEEVFHERDATMGRILALARDLNITADHTLSSVIRVEEEDDEGDQELPSSASDVSLSRAGSTYLLSTMIASSVFFNASASLPTLQVNPDFTSILASVLGDPTPGSTGAEPEPLIDAVLFLGFFIINNQRQPDRVDDQAYNQSLQHLSGLSANMPSPALRYNAHLLTSSLLHRHPLDSFRLAFIRDTLEHCPYENLKPSAIGWLKDETLNANRIAEHSKDLPENTSIFATPAALITLAFSLFPNIDENFEGLSTSDSWAFLQAHQPYYLAVLNFLFLLLMSPSLSNRLRVVELVKAHPTSFLDSLNHVSAKFKRTVNAGNLEFGDGEERDAALGGLELLSMNVQQVTNALARAET